jgi:putative ABC transport system permease protein
MNLSTARAAARAGEVGMRKVIGASKIDLLRVLSMEYIKLIFLANLVGWPVAYIAMQWWLQDFAYRTDMEPVTFNLTGLLTLGITLLTIGYHALKAARTNPVEALRHN